MLRVCAGRRRTVEMYVDKERCRVAGLCCFFCDLEHYERLALVNHSRCYKTAKIGKSCFALVLFRPVLKYARGRRLYFALFSPNPSLKRGQHSHGLFSARLQAKHSQRQRAPRIMSMSAKFASTAIHTQTQTGSAKRPPRQNADVPCMRCEAHSTTMKRGILSSLLSRSVGSALRNFFLVDSDINQCILESGRLRGHTTTPN